MGGYCLLSFRPTHLIFLTYNFMQSNFYYYLLIYSFGEDIP
jgi:hypothetical protein